MAINMSATLMAGLFGQQGQTSLTLPFGNTAQVASAGDSVVALRRVMKAGEEAKGLEREKKDPVTLTALAQFRKALESAPNLDKALTDPRVLKVLMPALGLPDQVGNPGLVKRALLSDPNDPKGIAAQLGTTWKSAAATLNLKATTTPKTVAFQGLADSVTTAIAAMLRPGEAASMTRAKLEVNDAATRALAMMLKGEPADFDLPTAARDALKEMAKQSRNGAFDAALQQVDAGLLALDQATGITAADLKKGRAALMEAGISLEQLRRNASGVVTRIEALVALDTPDRPAMSAAFKARIDALHKDGVDKNVNFPLEVASALASRRLSVATNASEVSEAVSLISRSSQVLSSRDGRVSALAAAANPVPRISRTEAVKITEAMKAISPLGSLADPKMIDILINGYTKYEYRTGLSEANPGMADAMYFIENAKDAKSTYNVLGNRVLRRVVMGALGLPDQIAIQPVETQARAVQARLKLADLQNPDKIRALAERYLMAEADKAAANAGTTSDPFALIAGLSIRV
ncbi:MAG: hypothetical protein RL724_284 [Pseudomonadota bacterium]